MSKKSGILVPGDVEGFADRVKAAIRLAERGDALRAAVAQVVGRGALPGRRGPGRPPKAQAGGAARGGPRKRMPGVEPEKVLALVKAANGPINVGALAKQLRESPPRVRAALMKLREEKAVTLTGERSTAKWSAA